MKFNPDWYSPPGDTIADILHERKLPLSDFARYMNISLLECGNLLSGNMVITKEIAKKLSEVLGSTVRFWLNRELGYRKDKARIEGLEFNELVVCKVCNANWCEGQWSYGCPGCDEKFK